MVGAACFWLVVAFYCLPVNTAQTMEFHDDITGSDVKGIKCGFPKGPWGCRIQGIICDCSSIGLCLVPPYDSAFEDCTELNLFNNSISQIDRSFQGYKNLKRVTLTRNKLSKLGAEAFVGLDNLEYLNLAENRLNMTSETFPLGVFKPLGSLLVLELHDNTQNADPENQTEQYPDQALADLKRLTNLSIDGLPSKIFGPGFREMHALRNLTLTGYCDLGDITDETFTNLQGLQFLNVSFCGIFKAKLDNNALSMLTNLEFLDISWNEDIGLHKMTEVLKTWQNSTLLRLKMEAIESRYATGVHVTEDDALSLPRTLKILEAASNAIENVDGKVFKSLPINLTTLDLSDNWLGFGPYLSEFHKMNNLETLFLDGRENAYGLPNRYPKRTQNSHCSSRPDENSDPWDSSDFSYDTSLHQKGNSNHFRLPHKLKYLSIANANLCYQLTKFQINTNNSLTQLILSGNILPSLVGPFKGFNKLEILSITRSRVQTLSDTFFQNMTSLKYLDLSRNILGQAFYPFNNRSIFGNLKNLQFLNLSHCDIQRNSYLHNTTFKGLTMLEELHLQGNPLWGFNTDIKYLRKLRVLNLSNTQLTHLDASTRKNIDRLIFKFNVSIQVDMSHNPILCNCSNKYFIEWIATSKAFHDTLTNSNGYFCVYDNANWHYVNDGFQSTVREFRRLCHSNYKIFLESICITTLIIFGVLGALIHHFRWRIRYFYYGVYLLFKDKRRQEDSDQFPFDVFVSYSFPDEDFVMKAVLPELTKRGLKLHVHGRDFKTGDYIASNIVTAVKESRKTLVVLTHALISSNWCNYELQMANMESVYTGRNVLLFLLKEHVDERDLGTHLLTHIRNNTYIPYPQTDRGEVDETVLEHFWDKLASDLKL